MKLLSLLLALCVATPAWGQSHQDIQKFRDNWAAAEKVKDTPALERLMRQSQAEAVFVIRETAKQAQGRPDDKVFARLEQLRIIWKSVFRTDFVLEMERFYSFLDRESLRVHGATKTQYDEIRPRFDKALLEDELTVINPLSTQMEILAARFEEIGDKYLASQAWYYVGDSWIKEHRPPGMEDLKRAAYGYRKCVDLRTEIGLKDRIYAGTEDYLRRLSDEGVKPEAPAEPGAPAAEPAKPVSPVKVTGAPLRETLEFELAEDFDKVRRPNFNLDAFHGMWYPAYLDGTGSRKKLGRAKEAPHLMRVASSEVHVDVDNDGEPDQRIKLTGNVTPVKMKLGSGSEEREWGCLVKIGFQEDVYQNLQVNSAATDDLLPMFVLAGGSIEGSIGGTKVRIFDEDLDGVYGSPPLVYGNIGITKKNATETKFFQPEFDSVLVGKEKMARPWSEYQKLGKQWYKMTAPGAGQSLEATPVELPEGTAQLSFKGGKPSFLILKGEGDFANSYFNVAGGKTDLPAGRYSLFIGEMRKGKKLQAMKALILPGEQVPSWTIAEGETTKIELGAPFGFEFDFTYRAGTIEVNGHTVVVTGSKGERYERAWNCVPQPTISYRKTGTKKSYNGGEMKLTPDLITGDYGYEDAWFPLTTQVEIAGSADEVEVRLSQKKHKIFGKIESVWKGQTP